MEAGFGHPALFMFRCDGVHDDRSMLNHAISHPVLYVTIIRCKVALCSVYSITHFVAMGNTNGGIIETRKGVGASQRAQRTEGNVAVTAVFNAFRRESTVVVQAGNRGAAEVIIYVTYIVQRMPE